MDKILLELYCEPIRNISSLTWKKDTILDDDMNWIQSQCNERSHFDPKGFRFEMYKDLQDGKAKISCWKSNGHRMLIISHDNVVPTDDFSIALQMFSKEKPYRVVWLAHPSTREFPRHGEPGPVNVNGGYTYPCSTNSIVIYRKEEALRVLIHELLHASCTDDTSLSLPIMESRTEAWAEVIYCAVLAKGNVETALRLWKHQVAWILDQSYKLMKDHNVNGPNHYIWRYTVGKMQYLDSWGLLKNRTGKIIKLTTRLTNPTLERERERERENINNL